MALRDPVFHCRDCAERHPGCHSTCEIYKADKEAHEKKRQELREWEYGKGNASETIIAGINRRKKQAHLPYGNNPHRRGY